MWKIIGEIPARYQSKRIKRKNLKLLAGKPLICYAIEAAKRAEILTEVFVNSESEIIGTIARENGVKFYKRDSSLAKDEIVSDQFNYDFIKRTNADILVMINPVSPLITGSDIDEAVNFFLKNHYDSLISVREERLQAFCADKPINFNPRSPLARTQDILPIQLCVWAICIWRAETFLRSYKENGYAVFSGKLCFYPLDPLKSIKISTEKDFILAQMLLRCRKKKEMGTENE